MSSLIKTYSELITLDSFVDRFNYLKLGGYVGEETFGSRRYLNQTLYRSPAWKHLRDEIVMRDGGCDLGIEDRTIFGRATIHHINPISIEDIVHRSSKVLDPENLICVSADTHRAIHYGDLDLLMLDPVSRLPGDTCLWRR